MALYVVRPARLRFSEMFNAKHSCAQSPAYLNWSCRRDHSQ